MRFSETNRTRLRSFQPSDLENMIELESDPEVMKFTSYRIPQTRQQTEERLKTLVEKESSHAPLGVWAAELKDTGDFVGWFMLLKARHELPELGFMIVQRHWGKGLVTEAASSLTCFGLNELSLPKIVATTHQQNHASKRVLEKLGFKFSKTVSITDKVLNQNTSADVFELSGTVTAYK
jgi:RimJ/RimL family protein N-acetyltransferase